MKTFYFYGPVFKTRNQPFKQEIFSKLDAAY